MATTSPPIAYNTTSISATTTIRAGNDGALGGILIASATAAIFSITDGAGGTIMANSAAVTAAAPTFVQIPAMFTSGVTITLVSGAMSATVFWL